MNEPVWGGRGVVSRAYLSYVRRFPAVRGKLRVGRAIADHLGTLAVVGENGARFSLDPGEWITWMVALHGEHGIETRSVRRATALMSSGGGVVVDVGAAWGLYTCSLGVLPGVNLISVEPTPRNFLRLRANIALNPAVRAQAFAAALGDAPGIMAMGSTVSGNSLTTSAVTAGSVEYHTAVVTPTMLLDSVDIKAIRLLKVDVEGYEMRIFRAWPWKRVRPQHILCEFHEPSIEAAGESVAGMLKFFRELGYVARNVDGERHRRREDSGGELAPVARVRSLDRSFTAARGCGSCRADLIKQRVPWGSYARVLS